MRHSARVGQVSATLQKRINVMQKLLPGVIAMAAVVVASNILVQFLILDGLLTWGAFTYPIAFLVTDLTNRYYGRQTAQKVVLAGFVVGVICSLIGSQVMLEFGPAVPLRIGVASGIAFLVAQLIDVAIFDKLRTGAWWRAPLASTIVGSILDTAVFFTLAFSLSVPFYGASANEAIAWASDPVPFLNMGAETALWHSLAVADWMVKMTVALIALIPFRILSQGAAKYS